MGGLWADRLVLLRVFKEQRRYLVRGRGEFAGTSEITRDLVSGSYEGMSELYKCKSDGTNVGLQLWVLETQLIIVLFINYCISHTNNRKPAFAPPPYIVLPHGPLNLFCGVFPLFIGISVLAPSVEKDI